jgi:hypothetical protein
MLSEMAPALDADFRSKLKRWVAFLISPAVWTSYFMVVYAVNETVCGLNVFRSVVWGQFTTADLIMFVLTGMTMAATGVGFYLGYQIWRNTHGKEKVISTERDYFMGLSAMLLGSLFAVLTLGMTAVIIFLRQC